MPKRINELEIKVTKAIITKISIELDENKLQPEFEIQGSLISDKGRKVSSFIFYTGAYSDTMKLEVPPTVNFPASELFKLLTPVIYEKINGVFKGIEAPKNNA